MFIKEGTHIKPINTVHTYGRPKTNTYNKKQSL